MTRLKKVLQDKGITQKELAANSDVGEYKISLLCSGKSKNIHLQTAKKICDTLELSLDEVFGDIMAE